MAAEQPVLSGALPQAEELMRAMLGQSDDVRFEPLSVPGGGPQCLLIYVEGMADRDALQRFVLQPLAHLQAGEALPASLADLGRLTLPVTDQRAESGAAAVRDGVNRGETALLVEGYPGALLLNLPGWKGRPVQSAPSETSLRGPRDGFVEDLLVNLPRIRRRLSDRNLRVRFFQVGVRSQTRVALLYIADLAPQRLVDELASRLGAIEFDALLDAHQLRELLVGQPSPFPKMDASERPDKVVAALVAGRAAVLVDNSPFALVAPTTIFNTLWAADDYYGTPAVATLVRLVRVAGVVATLFLSPLYIGVELYHPGLIRTDLVLYLARERAGVPLNPALEILFLELMMEMVHEATIRLPSKVGSAATVVGGLIVGQAAVEARLLSGIVVIVAAVSAIGSFTLPGTEMGQVWRLVKWGLIVAAIFLGVYGIFAASFLLFAWLVSQDSFGTPYMAPLAPLIPSDLKRDGISRSHWGRLLTRARTYRAQDRTRTPAPQAEKYRDGGER